MSDFKRRSFVLKFLNVFGSFISLGFVFLNAFLSSPLTLVSPGVSPLPNGSGIKGTLAPPGKFRPTALNDLSNYF